MRKAKSEVGAETEEVPEGKAMQVPWATKEAWTYSENKPTTAMTMLPTQAGTYLKDLKVSFGNFFPPFL